MKFCNMNSENNFKVLLGCLGDEEHLSTTITLVKMLKEIKTENQIDIKVIVTSSPSELVSLEKLHKICCVLRDEEEWDCWKQNAQVLHIELRRWADIFVIAPLNADYLARITCGLCDDLLTCVSRAWDLQKPLMFCPAMSLSMWNHPITANHIAKLKDFGYKEISCTITDDYCEMADVTLIVSRILETIKN